MLKHQEPKVFASYDMREMWPEATVKYLEKLIEYVSNEEPNSHVVAMTSSATETQIGKAIQVLCKYWKNIISN